MPLTLSGRRVARDTTEHPSLTDIAVGLSRMPRFAGQTKQWFSVLDHTMFGLYIIEDQFEYRYDKRWWLLHDAHESMTGDVPTDLKTDGLRLLQEELDYRIFDAFYPQKRGAYSSVAEQRIKDIDNRCLRAEARVLKGVTIGGPALEGDVTILEAFLRISGPPALGRPPFAEGQEDHPLVKEYIARMIELM